MSNMNNTTPLLEWLKATVDLRKELHEAAYAEAYAEIDAARKKRGVKSDMTHTQREKAHNIAKTVVLRKLYHMAEYNGVRNPIHDDEEFGPNAKSAQAYTPNKYAGKCKCGGWVEAEAGKLVKRDGKWASEHITCPETPKAAVRSNSYPGTCVTCSGHVEAKAGRIEKDSTGRWATFHLDGECPEVPEAPKGLDLSGLVPGYYAVPGGDTRLKIAVQHGKPGTKWEGFTFVKDGAEYGAQQRYGMQRPGQAYRGQIEAELAKVLEDPKAAMQAYGKLVGRCGACGRTLEDEYSVANGIGPVCAQKW